MGSNGPSWLAAAGLGLASRVVVVVLGVAVGSAPWPDPDPPADPVWERYPHPAHRARLAGRWLEPWYRFDANWYAEVARAGYSVTPGEESTVAFFPLLPSATAAGARAGLDPYLVGLLLPNLAFAAGLGFFARAVVALTGDGALAWRACGLLVVYPFSFFGSAPYPEGLAVLALAASLWGWATGRWWVAAVALAVGVLARPNVAVLPAALLLDRLAGARLGRPPWPGVAVVMLAPLVTHAAFCWYLSEQVGDPFAFVTVQEAWGRSPPSPAGFYRSLEEMGRLHHATATAAVVGFLVLGVLAFRRGVGWGVLAVAPLLQLLATGMPMSAPRLALTCLPAFVEAAALLRHRGAFWAVVALSGALQLTQLAQFVHWRFAG